MFLTGISGGSMLNSRLQQLNMNQGIGNMPGPGSNMAMFSSPNINPSRAIG